MAGEQEFDGLRVRLQRTEELLQSICRRLSDAALKDAMAALDDEDTTFLCDAAWEIVFGERLYRDPEFDVRFDPAWAGIKRRLMDEGW